MAQTEIEPYSKADQLGFRLLELPQNLRIMMGPNGIVAPPAGSAAKAARARELGFEDVIDLIHGRSRRGRSPDYAGQGRRYRYREHLRHRDQRGLETPWSRRCPDHVGLFRRTQNHDRCDRPDLKSTRMAGFSLFAQSATAIATAQGVWDARRSSTHLNEHQAVRRDNKAAQNLFGIPHRYKAFLNLRFDTANRGVSQDSLERREFCLS
jgi:hypothetical protein